VLRYLFYKSACPYFLPVRPRRPLFLTLHRYFEGGLALEKKWKKATFFLGGGRKTAVLCRKCSVAGQILF